MIPLDPRPVRSGSDPKAGIRWLYRGFVALIVLFVGAVVVIVVWDVVGSGGSSQAPAEVGEAAAAATNPSFPVAVDPEFPNTEMPGEPNPQTGVLSSRFAAADGECPVAVTIPKSTDSYFVKFEGWNSHTPVATLFIRAGESTMIALPAGKYRVKWAAGPSWHGTSRYFGTYTTFNVTVEPMELRASKEGGTGGTLWLEKTSARGLRSQPTQPREF